MRPENLQRIRNTFASCLEAKGVARGVRAAKKADAGELFIYDEIGDSFLGGGVTAKDVADRLAELAGCRVLNVYVNSPGGSVFEGKAIYNQLSRFDATKVCTVDGIAASAASFICMAADRIVMAAGSTMMVHRAMGGAMGYADDLRSVADVLDLETKNIAGIYAKRTGRAFDDVLELMAAETWMDPEQAVDLGFADELERGEGPKNAAPQAFAPVLAAVEATMQRLTPAMVREVRLKRLGASPGEKPASRTAQGTK